MRWARILVVAGASIAFLVPAREAAAQTRRAPRGRAAEVAAGPKDYTSRNFLVHTDLPPEKAEDLLKRLEVMLGIISKYWGQPNRATIELYVVDDLANWPEGVLHPEGLQSIQQGGGLTITGVRSIGGTKIHAKAVVYAVADHGTPQHEAVHAYCGQNFGETGPTWYAEGMAEMGNYWRVDDSSVELPEVVLAYLQESETKPLLAIVDNTDQTGDSWQNYAWRWALCHMLANNGNYASRFRPLGLNLLLGKPDSFERTYGTSAREIEFEYHFFLNHLENGLRADLTAWDWKAPFKLATRGRGATATIQANRGWQPSRLRVEPGKEYKLVATGNWKVEKEGTEVTADGAEEGKGKLTGILFDPQTYTLGEPFDLGADLAFSRPEGGNLYLRCNDGWGALGDNSGKVAVKVALAEGK